MKWMLFNVALLLITNAASYRGQEVEQSSVVEGFVIKTGTGDPIARARVVLMTEGQPRISMTATTEGDGKFVFENVRPGSYRLSATRDGYVPAEFGQRGPSRPGTAISVGSRQQARDLRIQMTPTGAIAGRVYDRYGEPLGNAVVQALKYTYQDGRRMLSPVQTARTNDLGEYRLFWMQPGQYVVSAAPSPTGHFGAGTLEFPAIAAAGETGRVMHFASANMVTDAGQVIGEHPDSDEAFLPVYYPGTTDPASAAPIDLQPGVNFTGVDLGVADTRAVKIRGRVVSGVTGRSIAGTSLSLIPRGAVIGGFQTMKTARVNENGSFEIEGVTPGAYDLVASTGSMVMSFSSSQGNRMVFATTVRRVEPSVEGPPMLDQPDRRLGARLPLDVGNADVDGVMVTLQPGINITGRVIVEGATNLDIGSMMSALRVTFRQQLSAPQLGALPASVQETGAFSVPDMFPGDYRVLLAGLPRGYYVKAARLGNEDILNNGMHINGQPRGALEIVLGGNPGTLDAMVVDEKQQAQPGISVVLVPEAGSRQRPELYRTATTDASGRVHLQDVVPGNYKLFAWEDVENGAWQDPDFIRLYEDRGRPVRIGEAGRESAEVRLITRQ